MKNIIKYGTYKEWQLWKNENVLGLALRDKILENPMVVIPSTDMYSNLLFSFWGIEGLKEGRKDIQFIDDIGNTYDLYIKIQFQGRVSPLYRLFWKKNFKDYLIYIDREKYKEEIKIANQKGYKNPLFYLSIKKDEGTNFYVSKKITSRNYWYNNSIHKNSKNNILTRYKLFLNNLPESTEQETVTQVRTEQSLLRDYLIQNKDEIECGLCGKVFPSQFIWCSHIKKRSECTYEEKIDFENITMPMCKFGCDDLFEKGYIIIKDSKIKMNVNLDTNYDLREKMKSLNNKTISTKYFNENSIKYFEWHYNNWIK